MTRSDDRRAERIEQYLLGNLAAEEAARFDQRLLEDPQLFAGVEAAEDELIDRYVRGELSAADRSRFEECLLPAERIRNRLGFATALRDLVDTQGGLAPRSEAGVGAPPGDRRARSDLPGSLSVRLAWAACLVALLGAGLLALLNLRLHDRIQEAEEGQRTAIERAAVTGQRPDEAEPTADRPRSGEDEVEALRKRLREREEQIAALERRVDEAERDTGPESPGTYLFLALATRAGGEPDTLERPVDGPVEIQLGLDRLRPESSLVVRVRRNGTPIWRRRGVEPRYIGPDGMVSLTLPEEALFPGSYRVEVAEEGGATTTPLATYDFRVE